MVDDIPAMEVGEMAPPVSTGYASVVRSLGQNKRPRDDRTPASNLARHNSSPAGLFSSIDVETGSCGNFPFLIFLKLFPYLETFSGSGKSFFF